MDACELERLDGIVAGKTGQVYSYCITGDGEPVLANIEDHSKCYVLPFKPLGVYSGHDEGIYLSTAEGLYLLCPVPGTLLAHGPTKVTIVSVKMQWYL